MASESDIWANFPFYQKPEKLIEQCDGFSKGDRVKFLDFKEGDHGEKQCFWVRGKLLVIGENAKQQDGSLLMVFAVETEGEICWKSFRELFTCENN